MLNTDVFRDLRAAGQVYRKMRQARAEGAPVRFEERRRFPVVRLSYWYATMEGCLLSGETGAAVRDVFHSFSEEQQRALTFTPRNGAWCERVVFWKERLKPALPPEQYYDAMRKIIAWYIHCVKRRAAARKLGYLQ